MLALSRKYGQSIYIGNHIRISLGGFNRESARVGLAINEKLEIKEVPYELYQKLGDDITFFIRHKGGQVCFYFNAPRDVIILRSELESRNKQVKSNKELTAA
ncbi:carbon storage regulator [Spartinivicinus ruber]|uniref:carbon storage regulator n=1 Tax=Spartinivicinus ruber TaxID=2683272 RepID=UPI0013D76014|nr:carbon storage regulator [Spartinivicinus ruber]